MTRHPRRRNWWFIALSLALLAACVGVWKWSERPPYRFMDGAQLWFVEIASGSAQLTYTFNGASPDLLQGAREEFGTSSIQSSDGYSEVILSHDRSTRHQPEHRFWFVAGRSLTIHTMGAEYVRQENGSGSGDFPPLPAETTALVIVYRHPTLLDRFRDWLYSLKHRGASPLPKLSGLQ